MMNAVFHRMIGFTKFRDPTNMPWIFNSRFGFYFKRMLTVKGFKLNIIKSSMWYNEMNYMN